MDFTDFLSRTYYGNTVDQWAIALGIVLAAAITGKILYWFTGTVLRRLTRKTQTRLDDIVIDMVEEPIVFALTLGGAWYGLSRLTFEEAARGWIDRVVQFLIVLSVTWLIARLIDSFYREYLLPLTEQTETELDDQVLPILRKGTKLAIWSLGLIVGLNNAGYDVAAVLAGLGLGGLAIAMAARDTVSNVFGGFTIFTDRPFTIHDRIRVDGFDGVVQEVGIRSTRLRTLEGRVVTIPNSTFADSPVENVSQEPSRKVSMNLGLTYDTTPEQMREAMELLREIAAANEDLEADVKVSFTTFGDSAMSILFIYYIKAGSDILAAQSAINLAILDGFNGRDLEMAYPTQTVYHRAIA